MSVLINEILHSHRLKWRWPLSRQVTLSIGTLAVLLTVWWAVCNFAFFSGLISAQFWAGRAQPKSPELGANLLVMFPVFHSQQQTTGERIIAA